jgi:hypothetical protein
MGNLLVGVDLFSLFVEKKLGWPILFNYLMNVHLLDGLFFEVHKMKKEKECTWTFLLVKCKLKK